MGSAKVPGLASLFASLKQAVAQVAFAGVPCIHSLNTAADTAIATATALSAVPFADFDSGSHTLSAAVVVPK